MVGVEADLPPPRRTNVKVVKSVDQSARLNALTELTSHSAGVITRALAVAMTVLQLEAEF